MEHPERKSIVRDALAEAGYRVSMTGYDDGKPRWQAFAPDGDSGGNMSPVGTPAASSNKAWAICATHLLTGDTQ